MVLTLESIHQPLNDFFLNQFKMAAESPVLFRFDRFGSVVSDQDFIDPNDPELGYLPALVRERFSDLVNRLPVDEADGLNIVLSGDSIDTTYFYNLLSPAIACLPDGADEQTAEAIMASFGAVKGQANKVWEDVGDLESLSGVMLGFKPAFATPEDWYDSTKTDVWTSHSFQVTETTTVPAPGASTQLWKLKLSDEALRQVLNLPEAPTDTPPPERLNLAARVLELRRVGGSVLVSAPSTAESEPALATSATAERVRPAARFAVAARPFRSSIAAAAIRDDRAAPAANAAAGPAADVVAAPVRSNVTLHADFAQQYRALDVSEKVLVNQYIGSVAPTQSTTTSSLSISFDYCLVNIRRPWYVDAFINSRNWCIPSVPKGQATAAGPGHLVLMPIGFVAVRNLNITAKWSSEDVSNASAATDFGPFRVTADVVNNKLSHPGLQVVGWLLQKMPDLPPNDPPA